MLCPICKKPVEDPRDADHRPPNYPFCSERCKLIDLGRWLGGRYQIPVAQDDESDAAPPDSASDRDLPRRK
jgi:endogenous inhibitor of DNA gyrase (YacG/DUF329 family)